MTTINHADVLIIGAGMAGGAISKSLSDRGVKVICLEQGDWIHPSEYPHSGEAWEFEKLRAWSPNPNTRRLPEDYPVTGESNPLMFNAVGGSTIHFLGGWPRMSPADFRKGTEHGLAGTIDWPISYEDLEPYYALNDAEMGISGLVGDPGGPARPPRHGPPIAPGVGGVRAAHAFQQLGWHWYPPDNAILTGSPKDGRLPCNACGNCASGCPRGSLSSTAVTYWPKAVRNGVDLRTNARATRITLDNRGRAAGAEYVDLATGQEHLATADIVVVSANGIGTPRLLQVSAQKGHPDGLANGNGLVGSFLMHHTYAFVDLWLEQPTDGHMGAFGAGTFCSEFIETDVSRGFVNGFSMFAGMKSYGPTNAAMGFATGYVAPWGKDHREFFDSHFGHHTIVGVQGEDLPRKENCVTLDSEVTDSSGIPAARVEYTLSEHDVRLTAFGQDRAIEVATAMGAIETNPSGVVWPPPAWHLLGTARMGHSPNDSVTNMYHQTWEVPNLFVVDGSSFVTSGAVNPTSTIGALALRFSDYLWKNRREVSRQAKTPSNDAAPQL